VRDVSFDIPAGAVFAIIGPTSGGISRQDVHGRGGRCSAPRGPSAS
jgi:ABC-type hemin transport system ATPase subunit